MLPVAIVENDPMLPGAGWVGRVLNERAIPWTLLRAFTDDLAALRVEEASALVVLGGRQHAWEEVEHPQLRVEREAMELALELDLPILGCCLGGQILARALGGEVFEARAGEHGWLEIRTTAAAREDPLLVHAGEAAEVYLWHGDAFTVPASATLLAETDVSPQAFRVGRAWGLQFHPEVDLETYRVWHGNFPDACTAVGIDQSAADATALRRETGDDLFVRRMIGAFADVISGD